MFFRSYRFNTILMVGLGVIVTSVLMAQRAEAFSSPVPVVQSVSNPQMASVSGKHTECIAGRGETARGGSCRQSPYD